MILRLTQWPKAESSISFNVFGSVISSSPLFQKQLHPISSSLLPSLKRTYFRFIQFENTDSSIMVALFGMTILLILLPQKIYCPTIFCPSFSMADCKNVCSNTFSKFVCCTLLGKMIVAVSLAPLAIRDMSLSNFVSETKSCITNYLDHPSFLYLTIFVGTVWLLSSESSSY